MSLADARLRLLGNGYIPTPCVGKAASLPEWPKLLEPTALEIERWSRAYPAATEHRHSDVDDADPRHRHSGPRGSDRVRNS